MKFALFLSGCGQHDGSETHEVILTLLSLAQENIEWMAFAPDISGVWSVEGTFEISSKPRKIAKSNTKRLSGLMMRTPYLYSTLGELFRHLHK